MQAITPTMIIILAALQLTSNDVHSRLTRSKNGRILRPHPIGQQTSTMPLESMNFASNPILTSAAKDTMFSNSDLSSVPTETPSIKPEGIIHLA